MFEETCQPAAVLLDIVERKKFVNPERDPE